MTFSVQTVGKKVKSPQTGFEITLPGQVISEIRIDSNFGDNETNEGSIASVIKGAIQGHNIQELMVVPK